MDFWAVREAGATVGIFGWNVLDSEWNPAEGRISKIIGRP